MLNLFARLAIAAVLACAWFSSPARAEGAISLCVPVTTPNGLRVCAPAWTSALLNGLSSTVKSVKSGSTNNAVSTAPGVIGSVYCYNPNSSVAYIQLFDAATTGAVTLGTTKPILSIGIPQTAGGGLSPSPVGVEFFNGLQAAAATTATGATPPSTALDCNITFN